MWLNFILLLLSAVGSYFMVQIEPKSVQTITLLFTLFFSALLMFLHLIAFIYYRLSNAQLKVGRHNPK